VGVARGRPRGALPPAKADITQQVRAAVDGQGGRFAGNVCAVAYALGIPNATLRDLYTGRCLNPSLDTLRALRILGVAPPL
jgi:hypothetical protein